MHTFEILSVYSNRSKPVKLDRGHAWLCIHVANMKYEITDWAANKVEKRQIKSVAWVVHGVNQSQFQVDDRRYNREVNIMNGSCECRKW